MFKMCFMTQITQKIYLKNNDFFLLSVKKLVVWMDLAIFWLVRKKIYKKKIYVKNMF